MGGTEPMASYGAVNVLLDAAAMIARHEGYSQFPIPDLHGTVQIGHGTNLTRRGISREEAAYLSQNDVIKHACALSRYPWWQALAPARQIVLIDLAYALGDEGEARFTAMNADLAAGRYELAADQIESSLFAHEDKERARELAAVMRSGQLER